MNIGKAGLAIIKEFEGFRRHWYYCPAGKLTIGYGHVIHPGEQFDDPITEEEASSIMLGDLAPLCLSVSKLLDYSVTQNQFDAVISFVYNLGQTAFKGSTLLKKLNRGDIVGAADEFLRWDHIDGKTSDGLARRREAERRLFLTENEVT